MAQTTVNFSMDAELKKNVEEVCGKVGLSLATFFTMVARKVAEERRIPTEIVDDPFYSEANMARLRRAITDAKAGRNMSEHELIDVD